MGHATLTYEFYENEGLKKGISLPANVIHAFDAYILRCMHRRCNYDAFMVKAASLLIEAELINKLLGNVDEMVDLSGKLGYYIEQYERSSMADIVILPYLDSMNVCGLSKEHLQKLAVIVDGMLQYEPFDLITIHDSFAAHANNVNHLRQQYINIMAELADSNVLSDVLGQIIGSSVTYTKLSTKLSTLIRNSNYGLS